jgi:hypothetical protein
MRRLRRRKRGEWTCELFFLFTGFSHIKKNNSHVRKVLLAPQSGAIVAHKFLTNYCFKIKTSNHTG